jgi:hypothetical protein
MMAMMENIVVAGGKDREGDNCGYRGDTRESGDNRA